MTVRGMPPRGRPLTVPEAAERANLTERMVRRLVLERRIPHHKLGVHVRIMESDLDAFVEAGRIDAVSSAPHPILLRRTGTARWP